MWPWGHLAVAYLLYSVVTRYRSGRPPRGLAVIALAIGSQGPDLLDKPLGWSLGLLPGGRTLGHSVLIMGPVLLVIALLARRTTRGRAVTAFTVGYGSHLVADLPPAVLAGEFAETTYLFWPVLEPPDYDTPAGIAAGFLRYAMGPYEWLQLGLVALALIIWVRDGRPALEYVVSIGGRIASQSEHQE